MKESNSSLSNNHLLPKRPMRKITHLTEIESHYKEILPVNSPSQKNMAYSTFMDYPQPLAPFHHAPRYSQNQFSNTDVHGVGLRSKEYDPSRAFSSVKRESITKRKRLII